MWGCALKLGATVEFPDYKSVGKIRTRTCWTPKNFRSGGPCRNRQRETGAGEQGTEAHGDVRPDDPVRVGKEQKTC
jgi:hypothetical protein